MLKIYFEAVKKELENRKDRSAWNKGVTVYCYELLDNIVELTDYYGLPADLADVKSYALNGAKDWSQYSWGGSSLIYDYDIAKTLCNPTELKRTKEGERRPNSREEWPDVQARALNQAFIRIKALVKKYSEEV